MLMIQFFKHHALFRISRLLSAENSLCLQKTFYLYADTPTNKVSSLNPRSISRSDIGRSKKSNVITNMLEPSCTVQHREPPFWDKTHTKEEDFSSMTLILTPAPSSALLGVILLVVVVANDNLDARCSVGRKRLVMKLK